MPGWKIQKQNYGQMFLLPKHLSSLKKEEKSRPIYIYSTHPLPARRKDFIRRDSATECNEINWQQEEEEWLGGSLEERKRRREERREGL